MKITFVKKNTLSLAKNRQTRHVIFRWRGVLKYVAAPLISYLIEIKSDINKTVA
jgi:hypothetical protein